MRRAVGREKQQQRNGLFGGLGATRIARILGQVDHHVDLRRLEVLLGEFHPGFGVEYVGLAIEERPRDLPQTLRLGDRHQR